ncbi:LysR family transcriptional regulator [Xenophilus azovorans]|uniref:LysR family transcriptional regulator n=1 Tax=Xenophilus azovorans TaxID=151755 RepID=UPI00146FD20A|nr:LysR family transcriptional regulator [Xenophilus azovorans]
MRNVPSVQQLRAFVAIYRTGKIATAAAELSLTQSAVSVLLRQLESRLGTRLFDRAARALHRTQAADELIARADHVLSELAGMTQDMRQLSQAQRGLIRVAVTPVIAQALIPPVLERFQQAHPQVRVVLQDAGPEMFLANLLSGRADFGIGIADESHPELDSRIIMNDQLYLLCAPSSALASSRDPLPWRALGEEPMVLLRPGYGLRRKIDQAGARAGVQLIVAHEVTLYTTAIALTARGLGSTMVPASTAKELVRVHGLVARKLTSPVVRRPISVITRKGHLLPPAGELFVAAFH